MDMLICIFGTTPRGNPETSSLKPFRSVAANFAIDVQHSQIEYWIVCVPTYNLFSILDLFPNRTSDTCKIQLSRLDRILWSHRWWKVVLSQKFVNILIRNSEYLQVFEDSQILLTSLSGLLGVSWPRDPWFDSWCFDDRVLQSPLNQVDFMKKWWKSEKCKIGKLCGCQNFEKFELKISSIRIIRIVRKNSLSRIIRIFGQRINRSQE